MFQDVSCSDGGTPLSDRASLSGLDLQKQDSPEQIQNAEAEALDGSVKDGEEEAESGLVTASVALMLCPALLSFRSHPCVLVQVLPPSRLSAPPWDGGL